MAWSIYKITNKENNKIYIGQTKRSVTERWYKHRWVTKNGSILPLHNAISKYGKDNFLVDIVEIVSTQKLADERECFLILSLKSNEKEFGYNVSGGGQHSRGPISDETRNKLRIITKIRMNKPEMKEHMRNKRKEYWNNPINVDKRSALVTKRMIDNPSIAEKISVKTSLSIKNKWNDPLYREKQIASRKAKWADPLYREMMIQAQKEQHKNKK